MRRFLVLLLIAGTSSGGGGAFAQDAKPAPAPTAKLDACGELLPAGAIARIGAIRRHRTGRDSDRLAPDGKWLAVSGLGQTIELRGLTASQGRPLLRPVPLSGGEPPDFENLRFGADGQTLAAHDRANRRIHILDLASEKNIKTIQTPGEVTWSDLEIVLSRDRQTLVAVGFAKGQTMLFVWDLEGAKPRLRIERRMFDYRHAISADCRWCVHASHEHDLDIVDLTTGKTVRTITTEVPLRPLAFSADGKQFIASGRATVRACDTATGNELYNQRCRTDRIYLGAFASDGKSFYLVGYDCITQQDASTGRLIGTFAYPVQDYVHQLVVTPEGKVLALVLSQAIVLLPQPPYVWDVGAGKMLPPRAFPAMPIDQIRFSSRGELYVKSGPDAAWWDPRTGAKIRDDSRADQTGTPLDALRRSLFARPHRLFDNGARAASLHEGSVRIWNTRTGRDTDEFVIPLDIGETARKLAVSADGKLFAIAVFAHGAKVAKPYARLILWDQERKAVVRAWKRIAPFEDAGVISPDNRRLAFSEADDRLRIACVDQAANDIVLNPRDHGGKLDHMIFAPDGRHLACAITSQPAWKVCILDAATGKIGRELDGDPSDQIHDLAYSHDGALLAGSSGYVTVLVWQSGLAIKKTPQAP